MLSSLGLCEETRILERHGGVVREGLRQSRLVGGERPAGAVTDHEHADDAAVSDHRNGEDRTGADAGQFPTRFARDRDPLVGEEVSGDDGAAFPRRQRDQALALGQGGGNPERLCFTGGSEDGRRAGVGVETEDPCSLRIEEYAGAVGDASGDQVAIERLREEAPEIGERLRRLMWELILHA